MKLGNISSLSLLVQFILTILFVRADEDSEESAGFVSQVSSTVQGIFCDEDQFPTRSPTSDGEQITFEPKPCRTLDKDKHYFCPTFRYCEWDHYSGLSRTFLGDIGYIRREWNFKNGQVGDVDSTCFDALATVAQENLQALGYTRDKHDCCNMHYWNYAWNDFVEEDGYKGVKDAFEALGYDRLSWITQDPMLYDDAYWDELPEDLRVLLENELCYTKELWDGVSINEWPENAELPGELDPDEYDDLKCLLECVQNCNGKFFG